MRTEPSTTTTTSTIIDKASYFPDPPQDSIPAVAAVAVADTHTTHNNNNNNTPMWKPTQLKQIPAFYPLEKTSRLIPTTTSTTTTLHDVHSITQRITECLRAMSVQALYDHDQATLWTAEHVEMHLSLWQAANGIVVEVQRRKGDAILYYQYARHILAAATGPIDVQQLQETSRHNASYTVSKKTKLLLNLHDNSSTTTTDEPQNAIVALEMAHSLLTKDRMDAQILGLESLCLMTDPNKTGILTALLTAHAVLLGSLDNLVLVQQDNDNHQQEHPYNHLEGPLVEIKETVLNLVQMDHHHNNNNDNYSEDPHTTPDSTTEAMLHDLALAVLANALDVLEHPERWEDEPESTRPRLRTASSNEVTKEFHQQEKSMLSTLIQELGNAKQSPHNATLSAQCLSSLLKASEEARRKAHELGAKTIVQTALDVGEQTHYKLEQACQSVVQALQQTDEEETDRQEEESSEP